MTTNDVPRWKGKARTQRSASHPFLKFNRWYESEEAYNDYRVHENKRRRLKYSGYPYTLQGWELMTKAEVEEERQIKIRKEIAKQEREGRDKIRQEFKLHRFHPQVNKWGVQAKEAMIDQRWRENLSKMKADQKLALIKELYDDETVSLRDILIRTCQIVGADIETLKRAN